MARRLAGDRAPDPPAGAQHQRGAGGVRLGHLRQGRRGAGDDRVVAGPGRLPRRPARLPAAHAWGNATAEDLYAALGEASGGRDVAGVMRSFTDQTGVPIIDARVECAQGKAPAVRLRQQEYRTLDRPRGRRRALARPVCVAVGAGRSGGGVALEALHGPDRARRDPGARTGARVSRVRLRERGRDRLLPRAHGPHGAGGARARHRPACPSASASASSATPGRRCAPVSSRSSAFLELCLRLKNDTSRLVWTEMLEALRSIDRALVDDDARPAFARFVRALCGPAARRLGWRSAETQSDDERFMREAILIALGDLGEDGPTLAEARAPRARLARRAGGGATPIWRASRCRWRRSAATRRCSIACVASSPTRRRPRRACWRSAG